MHFFGHYGPILSVDDHVEKSFAFECAWYTILDLCRDGLASIYGKGYIVTLNEIIVYDIFLVIFISQPH